MRGNAREVFLNHLLDFVDVNVARDSQYGIVWCVISFEETAHIFNRRGVYLSQLSVTVMRVVPVSEGVLPEIDPLE